MLILEETSTLFSSKNKDVGKKKNKGQHNKEKSHSPKENLEGMKKKVK